MGTPVKFTDLPSASALGGTEIVAGKQGTSGSYGGNVKILISQIGTYVRALFTTTPATIAEGGTNAATATAARASLGVTFPDIFNAAGDLTYASAADTAARLAIGTARQVLQVNSGATAPAWAAPITLTAEQASTSGTSIDFTGIPAGVRRITVMFKGVSTNGTSNILVQIGDAGGVEATGYLGSSVTLANAGSIDATNYTTGYGVRVGASTSILHGAMTLSLEDASDFTWVATGSFSLSDTAAMLISAGSKATSAELTQVRITTVNGTDAFAAGAINISYE